jgi:hypothetical protein
VSSAPKFVTGWPPPMPTDGLWGVTNPAWPLPEGMARGTDEHLAYLTLVYAISGGREPQALWAAARQTYADDAELFEPHFLAYAKPAALVPRLQSHGLSQKANQRRHCVAAHWPGAGDAGWWFRCQTPGRP